MIPFVAPIEDILFSLNHVAKAGDIDGYDAELHREIAQHFAAFAEGELAPLNSAGDREGAHLENGRVRLPEGFRSAYRHYCEQGWPGLNVPEAFGGQGIGGVAQCITDEIFTGANHGFEMTLAATVPSLIDSGKVGALISMLIVSCSCLLTKPVWAFF